ncbi:MAG: hypothetical protein IKK24_04410, partial [Clostridia bacterium]|nr:hypothetical protein [Clostridia bacterium]
MKKTVKILSLILAVVFCFTLCGCDNLDSMRKEQAVYTEMGSIIYNGNEYYLLPECDNLQIVSDNYEYAYVTAKDVPVLLSTFLGEEYVVSDDGVFLYSESIQGRYCRKDKYESVLHRIENGYTPEGYLYSYYDYINDKTKYYRLSDEDEKALKTLVTSVTPEKLPEMADIDYEYYIDIMTCSDDMLFADYAY